ncbi:class I SAM-dependent methyltransferase [Ferruginibacter sp. SUN002]|uniref:class I SAM-dependent methyltransferase n=1 Tax=Ferruginibacter sp. SUN002 TaxID=2937789 RepID=UPI003D363E72
MNESLYVQYGCGLAAPEQWINFDASPTLRIQKTPLIGSLMKSRLNTIFPDNVRYGDIVKGLPVKADSCMGVYCSHTLEHLSLNDFRTSLKNTYAILKPGGIFRCVVPDLEIASREYLERLDNGDKESSIKYIDHILIGLKNRPKGIKAIISSIAGNSHHLWMWDHASLALELEKAGFKSVRRCTFNDSADEMFKYVENEGRFWHAAAIEAIK